MEPTERELQILQILWELEAATVRQVYERLRADGEAIAQNTVQAFLRIMTEKGLVTFRQQGRAFVYHPTEKQDKTKKHLVQSLMRQAFAGAVDALVQSAFDAKKPSQAELDRIEEMIQKYRTNNPKGK